MKRWRTIVSCALAVVMAGAMMFSMPAQAAATSGGSKTTTYEKSVKVEPDKNGDFDGYEIKVIYTKTRGSLTSVEVTSEWGIKKDENIRYTSNALLGYVDWLKEGAVLDNALDAVSGATCSGVKLVNTYDAAYEALGWNEVAEDIQALVNGEVIEASADHEDGAGSESEEGEKEEAGESESGKGESGKGESSEQKGQNSLEAVVEARYLGEENGWRTYQIIPENGYTWTDVKLIRLNNSAYMPAKHDVTNIYKTDFENNLFLLNMESEEAKAATDLSKLTIVTVLTSDADETATGTVHVVIDLTDTTVYVEPEIEESTETEDGTDENADENAQEAPKTGDMSSVVCYAATAAAALIGAVVLVKRREA